MQWSMRDTEICNALLNMYCCNVSYIALWASHMYHRRIWSIRNASIIKFTQPLYSLGKMYTSYMSPRGVMLVQSDNYTKQISHPLMVKAELVHILKQGVMSPVTELANWCSGVTQIYWCHSHDLCGPHTTQQGSLEKRPPIVASWWVLPTEAECSNIGRTI